MTLISKSPSVTVHFYKSGHSVHKKCDAGFLLVWQNIQWSEVECVQMLWFGFSASFVIYFFSTFWRNVPPPFPEWLNWVQVAAQVAGSNQQANQRGNTSQKPEQFYRKFLVWSTISPTDICLKIVGSHSITSQNIRIFVSSAVRTSNLKTDDIFLNDTFQL